MSEHPPPITRPYREFYESLSQAREAFEERLRSQGIPSTRATGWSCSFYWEFKEQLHQLMSGCQPCGDHLRALDIGCGHGEDLAYFLERSIPLVCGADLSFNQLKLARRQLPAERPVGWLQADASTLPLRSDAFDVILLSEVLEHVPDPQAVVHEARRVLRPGGVFYLTTPNRWSYFHVLGSVVPPKLRAWLAARLRGRQLDIEAQDLAPHADMHEHEHLFSPPELRRLLERCGFIVEALKGGRLAVPIPSLFNQWPLLQWLWRRLDRMVTRVPGGEWTKAVLIISARKPEAAPKCRNS